MGVRKTMRLSQKEIRERVSLESNRTVTREDEGEIKSPQSHTQRLIALCEETGEIAEILKYMKGDKQPPAEPILTLLITELIQIQSICELWILNIESPIQ